MIERDRALTYADLIAKEAEVFPSYDPKKLASRDLKAARAKGCDYTNIQGCDYTNIQAIALAINNLQNAIACAG